MRILSILNPDNWHFSGLELHPVFTTVTPAEPQQRLEIFEKRFVSAVPCCIERDARRRMGDAVKRWSIAGHTP